MPGHRDPEAFEIDRGDDVEPDHFTRRERAGTDGNGQRRGRLTGGSRRGEKDQPADGNPRERRRKRRSRGRMRRWLPGRVVHAGYVVATGSFNTIPGLILSGSVST